MDKNKISAVGKVFKCAYTLSELVVVMLIIAVIVSVSIKLTKMKLDNITSYTYYAAYSTLRSVTSEMLRNFNAEDEAYGLADVSLNQNIFNKLNRFLTSTIFLPAFGADQDRVQCPVQDGYNSSLIRTYNLLHEDWNDNKSYYANVQDFIMFCKVNPGRLLYEDWKQIETTGGGGKVLRGYCCYSPESGDIPLYDDKACENYYSADSHYEVVKVRNWQWPHKDLFEDQVYSPLIPTYRNNCLNNGGELQQLPSTPHYFCCVKSKSSDPDIIIPDDYGNPPCGKEYVLQSSNYVLQDIVGFDSSCPNSQFFSWDACACVSTPPTVPRTGKTFCESFVGYANTSQLAEDAECKGDAIAGNTTDFNGKKPDFIFRNGMLVYNASQDPKKLDILAGNSKGVTYPASDDSAIDIDEFGYILYVDIDGAKNGDGVLWEDVYPFYVTLSGNVIPAYDENNPETVGGDSKLHLQTSVRDEYIDDTTGRHVEWLTKSKSFKESACLMNMVKEATPYCSRGVAAAGNSNCSENKHDCRLKTVMPVKFFGLR